MANMSNTSTSSYTVTEEEPENPESSNLAILNIYYVIGTAGVLANGFICVIIFRYTNMFKNLDNYFVISQSVIDCLACLFMIFKAVGVQYEPKSFSGTGGMLLCKLWYSDLFVVTTAVSSTYNSVLLNIDRSLKLNFPMKYKVGFLQFV